MPWRPLTRRANNVGLTILLGPAGLYSALAIVNATLIGAAHRRRPHQLVRLLGATSRQVRRSALWQAALVTGAGLLLGAATTAFLGWLVRRATTADLGHRRRRPPHDSLAAAARHRGRLRGAGRNRRGDRHTGQPSIAVSSYPGPRILLAVGPLLWGCRTHRAGREGGA